MLIRAVVSVGRRDDYEAHTTDKCRMPEMAIRKINGRILSHRPNTNENFMERMETVEWGCGDKRIHR